MLNFIVGPVDLSGAAVLIGLGAAFTVVLSIWLQSPSREDKSQQYSLRNQELANQRQAIELERLNNHEQALAKIAANRDVQLAQIEGVTIHQDRHEGSV